MKQKKKLIMVSLMSLLATIFCGAGMALQSSQVEAIGQLSQVEMQSSYAVGEKMTVPDGYFEGIKAEKTIYAPNGNVYRADEFTPTVMGNYTVEYSAVTASGYVSESKTFYAYDKAYEITGLNSKAIYGSHSLTPNTHGIVTSVPATGAFTYNKVIDLSVTGKTTPFISFYVTPEMPGICDAMTMTVTLTDAYDENNSVSVVINSTREGVAHNIVYISAGANFQPKTGIEWNRGNIHRDTMFGMPQDVSFFGCDTTGFYDEAWLVNNELSLFFDPITKQIHTQGSRFGYSMIIDLDDPMYFSELWSGFTTNEVTMEITVSNLSSSTMNFVITDIADHDLSEEKLVDTLKPTLTVDTLGFEELPYAVVGKPYSIFAATAVDEYSGELDFSVSVYENYKSPSQSTVNVVNGQFIPKHTGTYYVVYNTSDYSGNETVEVLEVTCEANGTLIVISVEEEKRITSAYVGETVTISEATAQGGSGKTQLTVLVEDEKGDSVDIRNGAFKPMASGRYTVRYTATDYVGAEEEYVYFVDVTVSEKPVIDGDATLPKYVIAGYEYTLPKLKAYDYTANGEEVDVNVYVVDDNGERKIDNDKTTFAVKELGVTKKIELRYEATNSKGTTKKTYEVVGINAKQDVQGNARLDITKYFYPIDDVVSVTGDDKGVHLTAFNNGTVEFINPLLVSDFAMAITMSTTSSGLGGLRITFADSEYEDKKINISLTQSLAGKILYSVNEQAAVESSLNYQGSQLQFRYRVENNTLSIDGENYVGVSTYADGSLFEGFPSGKIRVYFTFENITAKSVVSVSRINDQPISGTTYSDRVMPRVDLSKAFEKVTFDLNTVIDVPSAIVADVVSPNLKVVLTVYDPDNNIVAATDGTLLNKVDCSQNRKIKLSAYGSYRIVYTSEDDAGNEGARTYIVSVIDRGKPQITLSRKNVALAKKGETVIIASATVTDEVSQGEGLFLRRYIVTPSGVLMAIPDSSNSFVVNEIGNYKIRYMAYDEMGNMTVYEDEITVTA